MKPLIAAACALALTACATPRERVVYRDVLVEKPVPCAANAPQSVNYAADAAPLDGDIFTLVKALLVDREQRKATEVRLRGAVSKCGPPADPG